MLCTKTALQERIDRQVAEHELIDRLFYFWDTSCRGSLSLQVTAKLVLLHRLFTHYF